MHARMEWIQGDGGLREATMEGFACMWPAVQARGDLI